VVPSGASFFSVGVTGVSTFFCSLKGWALTGVVMGELEVEVLPKGAGCFIAEGTVKGDCEVIADGCQLDRQESLS
jgi:hypothetical protein